MLRGLKRMRTAGHKFILLQYFMIEYLESSLVPDIISALYLSTQAASNALL